jgi:surface protein
VSKVTNMDSMFYYKLSYENYDNILIGWSQQSLQSNVIFGAEGINYCNGADARQKLIDDYGWIITDGGFERCNITLINDSNFYQAINTCLSTNRVDGMCSDSEYGAMPDWDVSKVTSMSYGFSGRLLFNVDISGWDVSKVTSMGYMFRYAAAFNQDISAWDVSSVTDMSGMFYSADVFNQDFGSWDVSKVTNMSSMFSNADAFNQDISAWDVSNLTIANSMFYSADGFNQDIGSWDVSNLTIANSMFTYSMLSTDNYDNILIGWSQQSLQSNVLFRTDGINYCNGADARQKLIDDYGWTIIDGGLDCATAGIDDQYLANISIYPNPTNNTLFISGNETPITVAIFNVLGKEVLSIKNTNNINVQALPSGVYVIRISDGVGQTNRKFIKN